MVDIAQIDEDSSPMETVVADRNAAASQLSDVTEKQDAAGKQVSDILRTGIPDRPLEKQTIAKWEDSSEYKNAKVGKEGMVMGYALMIASLVGPLYMRTGAKGAMSALTAAINGWREGSKEKWDQARDEYDHHLKYVHNANEQFYKEWKELRARDYDSYRDQLHAAEMFFTKYGMESKSLFTNIVQMDKAILAAYTAGNKPRPINRETADVQKINQIKKELGIPLTGKLTPEQQTQVDAAYAKRYPKGKTGSSLPARVGEKTPAQWVAEVKKEHPDWTPEQIATEAKKRAGVK